MKLWLLRHAQVDLAAVLCYGHSDVPLAELIARFEEGNKLLQVCETRLKDAEMKIELLKKQNGAAAFASFAPEKGEA